MRGLPVPPAILYRRQNRPSHEADHVVLSFTPHGGLLEWEHLFSHGEPGGGITQAALRRLAEEMLRQCSPIVAFDAWVGNTDRASPRNAMVWLPGNATGQVYFIDFALSFAWAHDEHKTFARMRIPPFFLRCLERKSIEATVAAIDAVSDRSIAEIINRIPEQFLDSGAKDRLETALTWRKQQLRCSIDEWYPR
jgi:hypothetical protein